MAAHGIDPGGLSLLPAWGRGDVYDVRGRAELDIPTLAEKLGRETKMHLIVSVLKWEECGSREGPPIIVTRCTDNRLRRERQNPLG